MADGHGRRAGSFIDRGQPTRKNQPTTSGDKACAHPPIRRVKVWDLPTRLFHWALVLLIIVMGLSGELGQLLIHMLVGPAVIALILFRLIWG